MPGGGNFNQQSQSCYASGNIYPNRVVYVDTVKSLGAIYVLQAASPTAHILFGITGMGTRFAPTPEGNTAFLAILGDLTSFPVYITGAMNIMAEAGAAISPGDLLTSDSVGRVITTTSSGNFYIAVAQTPAFNAGDLIRVNVLPGMHS